MRSRAVAGTFGPLPGCGWLALALALILAWSAPTDAADVRGVVRVDGEVPAPTVVEPRTGAGKPVPDCAAMPRQSPRLVVDPQGGVQNAVVWLPGGGAGAYPAAPGERVLDQVACTFVPHIVLAQPGVTLRVRNSDPHLHNVRVFDGITMLWHEEMAAGAADLSWTLPGPGRFVVRCGLHPWMHAWVVAPDRARAVVTDSTGAFRFEAVSPGAYRLHVWHETLGELEQTVTVTDDAPPLALAYD